MSYGSNLISGYCGLIIFHPSRNYFNQVLPDEIWVMMADVEKLPDPIFTFQSLLHSNLIFLRLLSRVNICDK